MPLGTWVLSLPSAPPWNMTTTISALRGRLRSAAWPRAMSGERVGPLVGGEPEQRHPLAAHRLRGLGARAGRC